MTLQQRVEQLVAQHGSLRAAARAVQIDPPYLLRLGNGEKIRPSKETLRRMGLRMVIDYLPLRAAPLVEAKPHKQQQE